MDMTVRPLRIPPEMTIYAEKHELFDLIEKLIRNLIIDKPTEPINYLIAMLRKESLDVPRVFLLGPPAIGKSTLAKKLCEQVDAIHISISSILKEDTDLTETAQLYRGMKQKIPQTLWIKLIQQRLSKPDCVKQGWVLDAIPKTREEALCLQAIGILPDHVVMLQAPDAILIQRNLGKRIDPVTGDVYHMTFMLPESPVVAQRLQRPQGQMTEDEIANQLQVYHQQARELQMTYNSCLKIINADQPHEDMYAQVLNYVMSRKRSAAPHTPRILLFGPPGSGKTLQARMISQKYNIVKICCDTLLKAVAADDTSMGELIKSFLESGQQVPDSTVLKVLTERLSALDCTTRGWVLYGYPQNVEQAVELQESNFHPSRVFFLEMDDEVAFDRLTHRAVDPVTGKRYHSVHHPAPNATVKARLQYNPRDCKAEVQKRLNDYWSNAAALQAFYPQGLRVSADQVPLTVFECLESRLVGCLPKVLPKLNIEALSGR